MVLVGTFLYFQFPSISTRWWVCKWRGHAWATLSRGSLTNGLHLGRVQEGQPKIQWNIRHHKTVGAFLFLWWDIFDDIWCIQAGQENRVGELNCNAGSHDRQFPFISTVDSLQKYLWSTAYVLRMKCKTDHCHDVVDRTGTRLRNVREWKTWKK